MSCNICAEHPSETNFHGTDFDKQPPKNVWPNKTFKYWIFQGNTQILTNNLQNTFCQQKHSNIGYFKLALAPPGLNAMMQKNVTKYDEHGHTF